MIESVFMSGKSFNSAKVYTCVSHACITGAKYKKRCSFFADLGVKELATMYRLHFFMLFYKEKRMKSNKKSPCAQLKESTDSKPKQGRLSALIVHVVGILSNGGELGEMRKMGDAFAIL
jgi:hypothetical protein